MKRILLALALFALALRFVPETKAADVSLDLFYTNLAEDGNWIEAGDYGYCWQPNVAASDADWRPYTDGYWAYTDVGWTWVSYENFGWATYHYGRWARLHDVGWVWVPGTEWGPAWVSWRTGGEYVGWAPLPPRDSDRGERVYEGRPITGHVDIDYDIGPEAYNFVDARYIGEPVLRTRIFEPSRNFGYMNETVNVTNVRYRDGNVYGYGPDYDRLNSYSARPIQRLKLERTNDVDLAQVGQSGSFTKVQGNRLIVAAPQRITQSAEQVAPKVVKTKVERPDVESGWGRSADPQAKAKLQEKMKTESARSIPPPAKKLNAAATPVPPVKKLSPAATPVPSTKKLNAAATPVPPVMKEKGKDRGEHGKAPQQQAPPVVSQPPPEPRVEATPITPDVKRGKGWDPRIGLERLMQPAPPAGLNTGASAGSANGNVHNPSEHQGVVADKPLSTENGNLRRGKVKMNPPAPPTVPDSSTRQQMPPADSTRTRDDNPMHKNHAKDNPVQLNTAPQSPRTGGAEHQMERLPRVPSQQAGPQKGAPPPQQQQQQQQQGKGEKKGKKDKETPPPQ